MPTYNRLQFLPETVESILCQTLSDFELIIINDNSPDETEQWVKAQTDPRIKYIHVAENRGPSYARNKGLDMARGKYIAFADDDDLNEATRFAAQAAVFDADESVAVCGSYIQFFDTDNRVRKYSDRSLPFRVKALFEIPFHFPACMVRRSFIEKEGIRFRPEIRAADDYYFLMKIVAKGKAKVVPKVLYRYRWHQSSISIGREKEQYANELAINKLAFQEILNLDLKAQEIDLLHHFRSFKCKPAEAKEVEALFQKLTDFAEKSPDFNATERRGFMNFLLQRKLVFEKKKVQLAFFLIKNEVRSILESWF